jgi:hypothetical protein
LDVIISISSVVLSVSGILYCRHVAKHAGRDRPRDGAVIPTISIKDLKEFRVPIPSAEMQGEIEATFRHRQRRLAEARAILEEIEHTRAASWPHRELQEAET